MGARARVERPDEREPPDEGEDKVSEEGFESGSEVYRYELREEEKSRRSSIGRDKKKRASAGS